MSTGEVSVGKYDFINITGSHLSEKMAIAKCKIQTLSIALSSLCTMLRLLLCVFSYT